MSELHPNVEPPEWVGCSDPERPTDANTIFDALCPACCIKIDADLKSGRVKSYTGVRRETGALLPHMVEDDVRPILGPIR